MDLRTLFTPERDDFRGISLCAGYAGLDLGLHIAEPRYRTVAFVERESHAAAALVARMADQALGEAPIWDDLRSFNGASWRGRVHLVSAGYPCQPFSYAGKRSGEADPRHLWPEVARIVDEARPEWVWCENVEGHLSMGYPDVARDLRGMGYTPKAGLFTAREAGASHRRRRLFILAHADGVGRGILPGSDDRSGHGEAGSAAHREGGRRGSVPAERIGEGMEFALVDDDGAGLHVDADDPPIFAPGPGDFPQWARLLQHDPGLEPALLRADHGMADRVDRTRAAGNGVCSLAAALAWSVLKTAHQLDAR